MRPKCWTAEQSVNFLTVFQMWAIQVFNLYKLTNIVNALDCTVIEYKTVIKCLKLCKKGASIIWGKEGKKFSRIQF